ncbi:MAG TPA: DEAD/DEAH box helicase [Gammaproteobacteria bacterium]|nr:DEAD/DEAH box helicase [Gammaproteobacteria bacterium]
MIDLRPRQQVALDILRGAFAKGFSAPVLVAPCGFGKTRVSAAISLAAVEKGKRVLFITPRRNLVIQAFRSFDALGIEAGIHMAGEYHDNRHPISIASMDTIIARIGKNSVELQGVYDADLLIIDEAHQSVSAKRKQFLIECLNARYATKKKIIALTASPCVNGGGGLGAVFDELLIPSTMKEEIEDGYLLPPRYFACEKPDLSKIKVVAGEYSASGLGDAYDDVNLVGDVVKNYKRIAPGTAAVCFAPTRKNAAHLAEQFEAAGYPSAYLDANTPDKERQRVFDGIKSGSIKIITNVLIIGMGTDLPPLQTVILATATKSIPRWIQAVGRALRPYTGQDCAYIIDHGGMSIDPKMGPVEDITDWSLSEKSKIQDRVLQRKQESKEAKEIVCIKCKTVFKNRRDCPDCGHRMKQETEALEFYEADLQEVNSKKKANRDMEWPEKIKFYGMLKHYCRTTGKKSGYAAWKYKEKTGVWPNDGRLKAAPPIPPDSAMKKWITSQNIRFAKRKSA